MPGMGIALAIALIFITGIIVNAYLLNNLVKWGEHALTRIPVVKSIYNAARDFTNFIYGDKKEDMQQVVLVTVAGNMKLMGFITKQDVTLNDTGYISVYLPMSYQIGGYTIYVKPDDIEYLDINIDEAMRTVLTANIS